MDVEVTLHLVVDFLRAKSFTDIAKSLEASLNDPNRAPLQHFVSSRLEELLRAGIQHESIGSLSPTVLNARQRAIWDGVPSSSHRLSQSLSELPSIAESKNSSDAESSAKKPAPRPRHNNRIPLRTVGSLELGNSGGDDSLTHLMATSSPQLPVRYARELPTSVGGKRVALTTDTPRTMSRHSRESHRLQLSKPGKVRIPSSYSAQNLQDSAPPIKTDLGDDGSEVESSTSSYSLDIPSRTRNEEIFSIDLEDDNRANSSSTSGVEQGLAGVKESPASTDRENEKYKWSDEDLTILPTVDGLFTVMHLRVITREQSTGFEETREMVIKPHDVIAGRYEVVEILGSAAFSRAVQCLDHKTGKMVCMKVIKNNKDFFDQGMDEVKLLRYVERHGDPDQFNLVKMFGSLTV